MRILILNQTFYPDVAATAQHMWDLARYLTTAGHQVTALASRNVYGTDQAAFAAHETVEGIEIIRVGGTALGKRSTLHRMLDFASFYAVAGWKLLRIPAPDVILALTSPPMISSLAGVATRLRKAPGGGRIRMVYYVMDLYPEAAVASGMFKRRGMLDRLFSFFTGRTIARADAIIALGRDMRDLLLAHYGAKRCGDKFILATPWADGREIFPVPRGQNQLLPKLGLADTFNVVYSGNFGVAHDADTIIQAIELTAGDQGLRWVFIGGGKRIMELEAQAKTRNWKHVSFLPYQPREQLNQSLNMADVHLISQLPEFTGIVLPSKLFGIMAAGRPSVMVGPADCEVSRIIAEHDAGVVIPNGDAQALAAAIRRLRDNPALAQQQGTNARKAFECDHDVQVVCGRLEKAIRGIRS